MLKIWNESAVQKERFRVAANKLLNHCFLLWKREDTKKEYLFVKQNLDLFKPYFDLLGYDIKVNEEHGVIGLTNRFGMGRVELGKYESILLLILRLLYMEKRKELATYSDEVIVLMEEIREKYAMLKLRVKPVLEKGTERNMLKIFRRYHLIQNLDTDITQADARIVIYPSILMAVPTENIDMVYEMTEQKLRDYAAETEEE